MTLRRQISMVMMALMASSAMACHKYVLVPTPLDFIANQRPPEILVTRHDGTRYSMSGPQVFGDTVVGYVNGQYQEIKFTNEGQVRVRQNARAQTAMLLGMGVLGVAGMVYLVTGALKGDAGKELTDCDDDPYGCMMARARP